MALVVTTSRKTNIQMWSIFSVLLLLWLGLLMTSDLSPHELWPLVLLLIISFYALPFIGTFCIRVAIDDADITIPSGLVFRRHISIKSIHALQLRRHGLGLLRGIIIEYVGAGEEKKRALLPAFSTFGTIKTAQMIDALTRVNPTIRIDSHITAMLPQESRH
jgi:hypothetical protein